MRTSLTTFLDENFPFVPKLSAKTGRALGSRLVRLDGIRHIEAEIGRYDWHFGPHETAVLATPSLSAT